MTIQLLTATMCISIHVKKTAGCTGRYGNGWAGRPHSRFDGRGQPGDSGGRGVGRADILHSRASCWAGRLTRIGETEELMAFCPNCGAAVEGRYCAKCGTAVDAKVDPVPTPVVNTAPVSAAGLPENTAAALCYLLGFVTGIIFLVLEPYNKNKLIRFHADRKSTRLNSS